MTQKERSPPPSPTPIDFPHLVPKPQANVLDKNHLNALKRILLSLKTFADGRREHLELLNVRVSSDVGITDLLPVEAPKQGIANPSVGSQAPTIPPANANQKSGQDKYDILERELRFDNGDAFREIVRLPPSPGRQRIRVTQTRKFWIGLEKMAQYWDTEADQFFDVAPEAKRMKMNDADHEMDKGDTQLEEAHNNSTELLDGRDQTRRRYKGRRMSTGRLMPEEFREETVRAFVEMVVWAFGCQVTLPSLPPRLAVGTIMVPIRHSFLVGRSPKDRQEARQGFMEGPIMAIQCKNETKFRNDYDRVGDGSGEATDLLREVGALLLLAQERAREHQTEVLPGHDKWWTTKPRWGGGPGGEMEVIESVADEPPPKTSQSDGKSKDDRAVTEADSTKAEHRPMSSSRRDRMAASVAAKRTNLAERWKVLKPGSSLWEKKLRYLQIGKVKGDVFDDVSRNSHHSHTTPHSKKHGQILSILLLPPPC